MIKIVCKHCGAIDVRRDAWAEWNENLQEWKLAEVYDNSYCMSCDSDTSLKEEELNDK